MIRRARYSILLVTTVSLAAVTLTLSGCATPSEPGGTGGSGEPASGDCVVPRMLVTPATAHPGDTITVYSDDACDIRIPDDGWVVGAGHVGGGGTIVQVVSAAELDGSFRVELELTADFPLGEAYAGIDNWDYSTCPDTASCAGPTGSFTVVP